MPRPKGIPNISPTPKPPSPPVSYQKQYPSPLLQYKNLFSDIVLGSTNTKMKSTPPVSAGKAGSEAPKPPIGYGKVSGKITPSKSPTPAIGYYDYVNNRIAPRPSMLPVAGWSAINSPPGGWQAYLLSQRWPNWRDIPKNWQNQQAWGTQSILDWPNWRDIPKNWLNEQLYEPELPPSEVPPITYGGGYGGGWGGWGGYGSGGGYRSPYDFYFARLNWRI